MCQQLPEMLANATTYGARKPPGPLFFNESVGYDYLCWCFYSISFQNNGTIFSQRPCGCCWYKGGYFQEGTVQFSSSPLLCVIEKCWAGLRVVIRGLFSLFSLLVKDWSGFISKAPVIIWALAGPISKENYSKILQGLGVGPGSATKRWLLNARKMFKNLLFLCVFDYYFFTKKKITCAFFLHGQRSVGCGAWTNS